MSDYTLSIFAPKRKGGLSRLSGSKRRIVHPSGGVLRFGLLGGLLLVELGENLFRMLAMHRCRTAHRAGRAA